MLSPSVPPPTPYQVLLPVFPLHRLSPGAVCASLPAWSFLGFKNKGKESKMLLEMGVIFIGGKDDFYWGKETGGWKGVLGCPLSPPPAWLGLDLYLEG